MPQPFLSVIKWLANGETGVSSETLAYRVAFNIRRKGGDHPYDPADFNRCLQLLKAAPELKPLLGKMGKVSPVWKRLVARWDELEALFESEVGANWSKGRGLPAVKTHALMKAIINEKPAAA